MIMKLGVLTATAAAGLLAVSPLAFAGDYQGDDHHHGHHHHHGHGDHDSDHDNDSHDSTASCRQRNSAEDNRGGGGGGLINISDINAQVPVQACNNSIVEGVLGILARGQSNDDSHG